MELILFLQLSCMWLLHSIFFHLFYSIFFISQKKEYEATLQKDKEELMEDIQRLKQKKQTELYVFDCVTVRIRKLFDSKVKILAETNIILSTFLYTSLSSRTLLVMFWTDHLWHVGYLRLDTATIWVLGYHGGGSGVVETCGSK